MTGDQAGTREVCPRSGAAAAVLLEELSWEFYWE